jgi:hypothetical protein
VKVGFVTWPSLLYVISAVCSALYALTPAKRYVVTSRTAFEPDVTAELLTIARVNEAPTLAVSNLVTAVCMIFFEQHRFLYFPLAWSLQLHRVTDRANNHQCLRHATMPTFAGSMRSIKEREFRPMAVIGAADG